MAEQKLKKSRLTKILVEGDSVLLKNMAAEVEKEAEIRMEKPPQTSLVMMKALDSVSTQPFYMGEVLVTECMVAIEDHFGMGVIMGEEPDRAYQIAVIDAAFNAHLPVVDRLMPLLEKEEGHIMESQSMESAIASASRVRFDTMEDHND